jgi:NodT family efflux transporter outer membrane factor (OMF) lipoprotein
MGRFASLSLAALLSACAPVGPDFIKPDAPANIAWPEKFREDFEFSPQQQVEWWQVFDDPVLTELVLLARQENNNLKIAGLRVLESRALLGLAIGSQYPQGQVVFGDATALQASESNANTTAGDLSFSQYSLGVSATWELDFWGRFRRGIEAADANMLASIASYDDVFVLLAAQVADAYAVIRTTEEQLRIAKQNVALLQRSYEITDVIFRNGHGSDLDVQRSLTILFGTQASIPNLEISLHQAENALSVLLGLPPSDLSNLLGEDGELPDVPGSVAVGLPAEMLRQRPDIRRAELQAMAQNALVGVATADLYPSFSLNGTLGLAAAGGTDTTRTGDSGFNELFRADSVTYTLGASFVWPFLNYDRIQNNIRIEDARLQQALIAYRETVIQAAREVEDAMVAFEGSRQQDEILAYAVKSALRSTELSALQFREGFAGYQRVINAQQSQIVQQQRYVSNRGLAIRSLISLYRALGGGWQINRGGPFIDEAIRQEMRERTDWDELLELNRTNISTSQTAQDLDTSDD